MHVGSSDFCSLNQALVICREETALQRKLDKLAGQIGQLGLAAAAFALLAMAGQFTYSEFIVGNSSWDWEYLSTYLHFLITAITIVVSIHCSLLMSHNMPIPLHGQPTRPCTARFLPLAPRLKTKIRSGVEPSRITS